MVDNQTEKKTSAKEQKAAEEQNFIGKQNTNERIRAELFAMQDLGYKAFQSKLMPTVDPDTVIGIRTPDLQKFAKNLSKNAAQTVEAARNVQDFLHSLPHAYYEENNLHIFLLGFLKDYEECLRELNVFLPYVDNWATCDAPPPKVLKDHLGELLPQIRVWLADDHPYTVRYAIGLLMRYYLDDAFEPAYPRMVAEVTSEEYYVNMMRAWYFATALAKQYDAVLPYLTEKRLDRWTHNKTIQKAVESYRIAPEQKEFLKTLRRKY